MSPATIERPHLTWRDLFTLNEGSEQPTPEQEAAMNAYFANFTTLPQDEHGHYRCIGCGASFGKGDSISAFLWAGAPGRTDWTWGLAHGECHCRECGYPARALHRNVGPIEELTLTLPYHPSVVKMESDAR